jgi:hypothetical protein
VHALVRDTWWVSSSDYRKVDVPATDERWRLATRDRLRQQTVPLLGSALRQLELLRTDPALADPFRTDATLISISVAESALLLECLLEALADPQVPVTTRPPLRLEVRKQFLARALGNYTSDDAPESS